MSRLLKPNQAERVNGRKMADVRSEHQLIILLGFEQAPVLMTKHRLLK